MSNKVDLSRIPKWEVGKWYFYHKQWVRIKSTDYREGYTISTTQYCFTKNGKFNDLHKERDLLEPWEAVILYPECKETAPDGVDWSEPESEPDGMPTPEQIKSATEAFKGIDTEKYMAFISGSDVPWTEATESENATEADRIKRENDERIESEMFHIKAENKELKHEVQKLNIMLETERAGIVENFKEKTRIAEENEKLSTQLKDRNIKVQALSESANDLSYDLTQAQILIGKLALKLQDAGDL